MMMRQLFDADTSSYTYLVFDAASREAILIDPVLGQVPRDLQLVSELGLSLTYVFETHLHADHVTGAGVLREKSGAKTAASRGGATCVDIHLENGQEVRLGNGALVVKALATPGHTEESMSFLIAGNVFTGDALLVRGTGRTDFQGGDAGALYDSITRVLFRLPDDTSVWPAHDYKGMGTTTIGEERRFNPRLAGKTRDEFIRVMGELKLAAPRNIEVALPANLACGQIAPATKPKQ